jgi:hypothetical protein
MVELQHGAGAILPAVPNPIAFAAAIAAIGPDRIEPILNLQPPNAGALELGNIKKYEIDLAKQKIDADKAKAIIEDNLGPNMLTKIKELSQQPIPPGLTQRHKVIQLWAYLLQFTQENTKIIDDIRADFVKIPQVHSWAEAHKAVCVCNYLNLELRTMGAQHTKPDMELITIMTNIMVAECFEAIKYQVLAGNPHRHTIATAPLLGAPMLPVQNPFQLAVAAGFAELGIAFNPAHVDFQLQPAMTWATFSQSIQDHMTLDPKHGVHSALSIKCQPTFNAASSSSSSFSSIHDSGPEPKRQHRDNDETVYTANAAPTYEELETTLAAYQRQTHPYNGRYQYPPQSQSQQPRYQQFHQGQQYRQQGAQFSPRYNNYIPRKEAAGDRSQQPAHNGYQQQPQQHHPTPSTHFDPSYRDFPTQHVNIHPPTNPLPDYSKLQRNKIQYTEQSANNEQQALGHHTRTYKSTGRGARFGRGGGQQRGQTIGSYKRQQQQT